MHTEIVISLFKQETKTLTPSAYAQMLVNALKRS